jgi:hypothetical protein
MASLTNPKVLFPDEPTRGIDVAVIKFTLPPTKRQNVLSNCDGFQLTTKFWIVRPSSEFRTFDKNLRETGR